MYWFLFFKRGESLINSNVEIIRDFRAKEILNMLKADN
jgi:hypothetical protein|tara:strand:+ start:1989 stop:2102 length:114 start_codon:yes stop_codon:yes gene_type:complete